MAETLLAERIISDPFDMTDPALYAEDRWQAPFRRHRAEAPIHYVADSYFGAHWSVATYKPIVLIEALPKIFSSSWEYGGITVAFDSERSNDSELRTLDSLVTRLGLLQPLPAQGKPRQQTPRAQPSRRRR